MNRSLASLASIFILLVNVIGQEKTATSEPRIRIGRSMLISGDAPNDSHAESFLALNPKRPQEMVATSLRYGAIRSTQERFVPVYVTLDGGRTWRPSTSVASVPPLIGGDPIVYFDMMGAALFGAIEGRFGVWRSSDGGLAWNSMTTVPGGTYDRQYMGIDQTNGGPYSGRVYAAGAITNLRKTDGTRDPRIIGISYSTDNGLTFAPAKFIDVNSDGKMRGTSVIDLLITSRGTLLVPFASPNQIWTITSENGGATFSAPKAGPLRLTAAPNRRTYQTKHVVRAAIDASTSVFKDRIYMIWLDFLEGRYFIRVSYSDDVGATWSRPVSVNDNIGPGDPSNPAIAINQEGIVAVIWNDRRDDPGNDCYRLYSSASLDGGDTFLPNVQVGPSPTCPRAKANWAGGSVYTNFDDGDMPSHIIGMVGVPERFPNGGETQGLVAGPDGRFHAAWINGESGVMQLWYTEIVVEPGNKKITKGRIDRTRAVALEVSEPVTDFVEKSLRFRVRLKNISTDTMSGPITLVLDRLQSGLGKLTAANADNGLSGKGAAWRFTLPSGGLRPGAVSDGRTIQWRFDGQIPPPSLDFRLVTNFLVFADSDTSSR